MEKDSIRIQVGIQILIACISAEKPPQRQVSRLRFFPSY